MHSYLTKADDSESVVCLACMVYCLLAKFDQMSGYARHWAFVNVTNQCRVNRVWVAW